MSTGVSRPCRQSRRAERSVAGLARPRTAAVRGHMDWAVSGAATSQVSAPGMQHCGAQHAQPRGSEPQQRHAGVPAVEQRQ